VNCARCKFAKATNARVP